MLQALEVYILDDASVQSDTVPTVVHYVMTNTLGHELNASKCQMLKYELSNESGRLQRKRSSSGKKLCICLTTLKFLHL